MVCALLAAAIVPAQAGVYTDDMTKCLVKSASPQDQIDLVKWVFAVMAASPQVKPMANITDTQRTDLTKAAGHLMERLITKDCRAETLAALKYEGPAAFQASFEILGQVAMRGLVADPEVAKGFAGLADGMDKQTLVDMMKEAGAPEASVTPTPAK